MIFVDTNVLIDASQGVGDWAEWSETALAAGRTRDVLVSNHVVLAELAPTFSSLEALSRLLESFRIEMMPLTDAAAYKSGKAHAAYRAAGGHRRSILADFLIGGHAVALKAQLLTRDPRRFITYFPELPLITPEIENG